MSQYEHETQTQKIERLERELAEAKRVLELMNRSGWQPQKPAEPKNTVLREGEQPKRPEWKPSPAYTYTDGMGYSHHVPEGYHEMGH